MVRRASFIAGNEFEDTKRSANEDERKRRGKKAKRFERKQKWRTNSVSPMHIRLYSHPFPTFIPPRSRRSHLFHFSTVFITLVSVIYDFRHSYALLQPERDTHRHTEWDTMRHCDDCKWRGNAQTGRPAVTATSAGNGDSYSTLCVFQMKRGSN